MPSLRRNSEVAKSSFLDSLTAYPIILKEKKMRRAEDLLDDAQDFIGAAKDLFSTKRWAKVCFACQQAAELAVKAALNVLGRERRGHDVRTLLAELGKEREEILKFLEEGKILDQYYIPTRYMNAFAEGSARSHFTERQAEQAIKTAERILSAMEKIVNEQKGSY
jgi:HEPN domain-containing protein